MKWERKDYEQYWRKQGHHYGRAHHGNPIVWMLLKGLVQP